MCDKETIMYQSPVRCTDLCETLLEEIRKAKLGTYITDSNEFHKVLQPGQYMIKILDKNQRSWTFSKTVTQDYNPTIFKNLK